jgi:hypothetical protein
MTQPLLFRLGLCGISHCHDREDSAGTAAADVLISTLASEQFAELKDRIHGASQYLLMQAAEPLVEISLLSVGFRFQIQQVRDSMVAVAAGILLIPFHGVIMHGHQFLMVGDLMAMIVQDNIILPQFPDE